MIPKYIETCNDKNNMHRDIKIKVTECELYRTVRPYWSTAMEFRFRLYGIPTRRQIVE